MILPPSKMELVWWSGVSFSFLFSDQPGSANWECVSDNHYIQDSKFKISRFGRQEFKKKIHEQPLKHRKMYGRRCNTDTAQL